MTADELSQSRAILKNLVDPTTMEQAIKNCRVIMKVCCPLTDHQLVELMDAMNKSENVTYSTRQEVIKTCNKLLQEREDARQGKEAPEGVGVYRYGGLDS
jgi:hypothetical protein